MLKGCHTALITPLTANHALDQDGLEKLVAFQISEGIDGLLACGTTAESPTLSNDEQSLITRVVCSQAREQCRAIGGGWQQLHGKNLKSSRIRRASGCRRHPARRSLLQRTEFSGNSQRIRRTRGPCISRIGHDPLCHTRSIRHEIAPRRPRHLVFRIQKCEHRERGHRRSGQHGAHPRMLWKCVFDQCPETTTKHLK